MPWEILNSKKWQMIYLRAVIDAELYRNDFVRHDKVLEYFNKITVYSLGGLLTNNSMAFTGQLANENLSHLHIDKCFFSTTGISSDGRLLDAVEPEHLVLKTMLKQSKTKVYLCDGSKIGKTYLLQLCDISDVDYVISETDFFDLVEPPKDNKTIFIKAK